MAKLAEVHHDQSPLPPRAPPAPPMGSHIEPLQQRLDNTHFDTNDDHVNVRPTYHRDNASMYNPPSSRVQGGIRPIQSFSLPPKKKTTQHGSLRMYEFKMHKPRGQKPNWEVADRTLVAKTENELKARMKKRSKDKGGFSEARDFNSGEVVSKKGFKQHQIKQLLQDLQRYDQGFEWHVEFIELLDKRYDKDLETYVSTKMIVILSRSDNHRPLLTQGMTFNLNKAVVDLRPRARPVGPSYYRAGGGSQPVLHSQENQQAPVPRQHAGGLYGQNNRDIHDPRPSPAYETEDDDDENDQPKHKGSSGQARADKDNKNKKKEKIDPAVQIVTPKIYHADSDSSSDPENMSDGKTYGTSDTEVSFESRSSGKQYYSDQGRKKENRRPVLEGNREHYRKNPTEYAQETRGRSTKEDVVVQPASSDRRRQSYYFRDPSHHRSRPSRPNSEAFEECFQRYEYSPERPRSSTYEQRRLTQHLNARDEVDIDREQKLIHLQIQSLKLDRVKQRMYDRRQRYDDDVRLPLY